MLVNGRFSPAGQGTEIVIVETTLTNQTSGAVRMVIDRDAAELRIRGSVALKPVDVIDRSYQVETANDRYLDPDFPTDVGWIHAESRRRT